MHTRARFFMTVCAAAALGCASGTGAGDTPSQSRNSNVITRAEIQAAGLANMQDVIQQLRPQFLRTRGRTSINLPADQVAVYIDDVHVGTANVLNTIGATGVMRVEFVRGPDTGFKFGLDHQAGVIHIITK
jgi:outer membrane cobalamin receptor